MKRALITGIAGFAGSHLAEELAGTGWEVTGIEKAGVSQDNLAGVAGRVRVLECDILAPRKVERIIREVRPDAVFHLAAVTFVPGAEDAPQTAVDVNVKGSFNVLEGCRREAPAARVLLISSAEVYGKASPEAMPLGEERPPAPAGVYALTKLCAEEAAFYYARAYSLACIVLRPFNHIGPRQGPAFVTSAFARQIAEIEAGKRKPVLEVGNLEAARDFTDVRDVARAYRLAAERCTAGGVFNVCSGRAYVIREILQKMLSMADADIEVRQDPARLRRSDVPLTIGDRSRLSEATGWEPENDIDRTLRDILHYWRERAERTST